MTDSNREEAPRTWFVWQSFHGPSSKWWDLDGTYATEALARECNPRRFNATLPEHRLRLVERTCSDRVVPS